MTNKKISQLTGATTPLTGTEELAIVQDGQTVKATTQDVADLGNGGGSVFAALINPTVTIADILNALEGPSIPDSATDNYTKTIPLGFSPTTALCVLLADSLAPNATIMKGPAFTYGVSTSGIVEQESIIDVQRETVIRILVNNNYQDAKRAQSNFNSFSEFNQFTEVDENGIAVPGGNALSYVEMSNTLIGRYNGAFGPGSIGRSSINNYAQDNSILKSAYISGSNLVLLLKKTSATTGEMWTNLKFRVYDLS